MSAVRPVERLNALMRRYPRTGEWVNSFLADRGQGVPDWPQWCFMPVAAWYAVVSAHHGVNELSVAQTKDVGTLAALGTWRYTQGIYRFDPDMMEALSTSVLSGELPAEVLLRLPEWCVYVETPGFRWLNDELYGFWAHLEADANDGRSELRLLLHTETGLTLMPLHLGSWTVQESIARSLEESQRQAKRAGVELPVDPGEASGILSQQITPLISMLLYLCSDEPEVDDSREPGRAPSRPRMKKTKKGLKLFPAQRTLYWNVGVPTGEQLRAAGRVSAQEKNPGPATGRTVRTHIRQGHWHGYWRGPRDGERRFIYRWIHPLVVRARTDPHRDSAGRVPARSRPEAANRRAQHLPCQPCGSRQPNPRNGSTISSAEQIA